MIKTPVKRYGLFQIIDDNGYTAIYDPYMQKETAEYLIKRINLHEELEEAFSFCLDFFIDRASSKEDLEKIHKFSELLEKCRE